MLGDWPLDNKLPLCGGHEGAGTIVGIGKDTCTDLKIGDKVGIKVSEGERGVENERLVLGGKSSEN